MMHKAESTKRVWKKKYFAESQNCANVKNLCLAFESCRDSSSITDEQDPNLGGFKESKVQNARCEANP